MLQRFSIIIGILLTNMYCFSQITNSTDSLLYSGGRLKEIYNGAEITMENPFFKPAYIGGRLSWINFLKSKIDNYIPLYNKATPGTYHVLVRFLIDSKGEVKDVVAESNCGYDMEAEIVKRIKESPTWKPAKTKNGENVGYVFRQMVTFYLKTTESKIVIR